MKKFSSKLIALGMFLALSSLSLAPLTHAAGPSETPRVLSVTGEGKASATATKAVINVNIENSGKTAREAKMKNNEVLGKIRSSLASYGVTKDDVRIEWSNTYKAYGMGGGMEKMAMPIKDDNSGNGYTTNYTVSIAIRDVKKASEIADYLMEMENVNLSGTNYLLENNESATDAARELAVQDAKKKAEKLAKLYSVQLGKIANVSESAYTQPKNGYGMGGGMPSQSSEMEVVVNLFVGYEMN